MDEGLIQLLVIVGFVFLSMVEGVARQKRKKQQQQPVSSKPRSEYAEPHGMTDGDDDLETPEAVVPADLWQELVGIARGDVPIAGELASRSMTVGRESKPIPRVGDRAQGLGQGFDEATAEYEEVDEEEDAYDLAVLEGTHPDALVVRDDRLPEPVPARHVARARIVDDVPVVRAAERPRAGSFRHLFRNKADIQRAILIREILGPPVGMRD